MITLYNADALEKLKELPNDSIDAIITDPPYQLSSITKIRKHPSPFGRIQAREGFMNKEWDILPSVDILKECLRVLKAGGFALWLMTPRQDSLGIFLSRLAEAGFNISFTSLYWVYASGFPKGTNIPKAIAKKQGALKDDVVKQGVATNNTNTRGKFNSEYQEYKLTEEAKAFDGSYAGFQPKPAVEVIVVSMKPITEKTYVEQAIKNKHGITWLDDCRIPYKNKADYDSATFGNKSGKSQIYNGFNFPYAENIKANPKGRFPANLIVSDNAIDIGINKKSQKKDYDKSYGDVGYKTSNVYNGGFKAIHTIRGYDDEGDISRYFSLDAWWEQKIKELPEVIQKILPIMYIPKASQSERNQGLDNMPNRYDVGVYGDGIGDVPKTDGKRPNPYKNIHPTIKPIALMSYLITLASREGDTILDPFIGSGTTAIASYMLNRNCIGIEREKEYYEIAQERIKYYERQTKLEVSL